MSQNLYSCCGQGGGGARHELEHSQKLSYKFESLSLTASFLQAYQQQ